MQFPNPAGSAGEESFEELNSGRDDHRGTPVVGGSFGDLDRRVMLNDLVITEHLAVYPSVLVDDRQKGKDRDDSVAAIDATMPQCEP